MIIFEVTATYFGCIYSTTLMWKTRNNAEGNLQKQQDKRGNMRMSCLYKCYYAEKGKNNHCDKHMKMFYTLLTVFDVLVGMVWRGLEDVWDTGQTQRPCMSALFGD